MTGPGPAVTVGVVAYRHRPFIRQCLDSVLADPDCRLVVCDDASPDGTAEEIRAWAAELSPTDRERVTLALAETNRGLLPTLAALLERVDTPYVAYLAGDDWQLPGRLPRQVAALEDTGAVLAYGDCLRADRAGHLESRTFYGTHPQWAARIDAPDPLLWMLEHGNWIPAPTVLLRTEALRAVGGYDTAQPYEDLDTYARLLAIGEAVHVSGDPLAVHRELDDSLGARLFARHNLTWVQALARTDLSVLALRPDLAARIVPLALVRVLRAGALGADRRWLRASLGLLRPHLRGAARRRWWLHRVRLELPRRRPEG